MQKLLVGAVIGDLFLGGLLTVARADGIVKPEEMDSLRSSCVELGLVMPAEEDLLLAAEVTPSILAAAVAGSGGPYRSAASTPTQIGQAFLEAALRLARADQELVLEEVKALREFAAALGTPTEQVYGWHILAAYRDA